MPGIYGLPTLSRLEPESNTTNSGHSNSNTTNNTRNTATNSNTNSNNQTTQCIGSSSDQSRQQSKSLGTVDRPNESKPAAKPSTTATPGASSINQEDRPMPSMPIQFSSAPSPVVNTGADKHARKPDPAALTIAIAPHVPTLKFADQSLRHLCKTISSSNSSTNGNKKKFDIKSIEPFDATAFIEQFQTTLHHQLQQRVLAHGTAEPPLPSPARKPKRPLYKTTPTPSATSATTTPRTVHRLVPIDPSKAPEPAQADLLYLLSDVALQSTATLPPAPSTPLTSRRPPDSSRKRPRTDDDHYQIVSNLALPQTPESVRTVAGSRMHDLLYSPLPRIRPFVPPKYGKHTTG
jgi:hypothetical protein